MMSSGSGIDYFRMEHQEPEKRSQFSHIGSKRLWQPSSGISTIIEHDAKVKIEDNLNHAGHAYLTPDPSSQLGFSSPPGHVRRALASIPILRPKITGETITIGRSSVQCTHPIPQQFLNLHISRVHVIVAYIPETRDLSVYCRGLNPVYVDTPYETNKIEKGTEMRFREGEDIKINIAGYVVIVEAPEPHDEDLTEATLEPPIEPSSYAEPEKKSQSPPIETSPPESKSPSPTRSERNYEQVHQEIHIYHDAPISPRSSLSPAPDHISPPHQISLGSSPRQRTFSANPALLDALLTTLIFAEVKPTPLPRLLHDLSHRMPSFSRDELESVLEGTACIGIVHRSGKDAAGKELSNEYYYIAESCPSTEKADDRRW
jgi:hypothetical protein